MRQQPEILEVLHQVVATRDNYALQAMISELERSGEFTKVLDGLTRPGGRDEATAVLENALKAGLADLHHAVKPAPSIMIAEEKQESSTTVGTRREREELPGTIENGGRPGAERVPLMGTQRG